MTLCNLQPDGDGFRCTLCGWTYHKRARRNCPKSPEGRAGQLIAILHAIASKHENEIKWHMHSPRPLIDLEKNINICLDCDDYKDNTCTQRGTTGKARCVWLMRLGCIGFGECPRWKGKQQCLNSE
jgi:hypothetical protein